MMQRWRGRGSLGLKLGVAISLIVVADRLLWFQQWGWVVGLSAMAWIMGVALAGPAVRHRPGRWCLAAATGFALVMIEEPSLLAWVLFWTALTSAALGPMRWSGDVLVWGVRLLIHGVAGLIRPLNDVRRIRRARRRGGADGGGALLRLLALPVAGGIVFVTLFANANPLIGNWLGAFALPDGWRVAGHALFAGIVLAVVWPSLRPPGAAPGLPPLGQGRAMVALPLATLILSLAVFNAVFAVENIVDVAFLWSGATLPAGTTVSGYARQGAYLLIVTALLAGGFVLVALHPGTRAAQDRRVRVLVVLWVAQNVLLVASSARRLANYVAAYGLTELRIEAMAWMALVAAGLALIGWRLVAMKSAAWLVNANAVAAGIVLTIASIADIPAMAASYNVRHASAALPVNLCYLSELGGSALLPLVELERRAAPGPVRARVTALREMAQHQVEGQASDWHGWTWRGARRAAAARAMLGTETPTAVARLKRSCSGIGVVIGPLTPAVAS